MQAGNALRTSLVWRPEIDWREAPDGIVSGIAFLRGEVGEKIDQGSIFLRDPAKLRALNRSDPPTAR